jgi:hypothetical protein
MRFVAARLNAKSHYFFVEGNGSIYIPDRKVHVVVPVTPGIFEGWFHGAIILVPIAGGHKRKLRTVYPFVFRRSSESTEPLLTAGY